MDGLKPIALLGASASGKSSLALKIAEHFPCIILSLDSLSIYKHIDIASAKPNKDELKKVKHFGVDVIYPDEEFDVTKFFSIYTQAKEYAIKNNKKMLIVGGTSFYLKSMLTGLHAKPHINDTTKKQVCEMMKNPHEVFKLIKEKDLKFSEKISQNDRYRIEKWLEIYLQTNLSYSEQIAKNKRSALIKDIDIYELDVPRETLRQNIFKRTQKMLNDGLICEVENLISKYGKSPKAFACIGIKETIQFLEGKCDKTQLCELISIHTAQLAKRQCTFNNSQFKDYNIKKMNAQELENTIIKDLS